MVSLARPPDGLPEFIAENVQTVDCRPMLATQGSKSFPNLSCALILGHDRKLKEPRDDHMRLLSLGAGARGCPAFQSAPPSRWRCRWASRESNAISRTPLAAPRFRRQTERTGGVNPFDSDGRISSLSFDRVSPVWMHWLPGFGRRMNSGRWTVRPAVTGAVVSSPPLARVAFIGEHNRRGRVTRPNASGRVSERNLPGNR